MCTVVIIMRCRTAGSLIFYFARVLKIGNSLSNNITYKLSFKFNTNKVNFVYYGVHHTAAATCSIIYTHIPTLSGIERRALSFDNYF